MITTKKIDNLKVQPPNSKKKAFAIKTPPNLPKLCQLACVIGARGSGKGVSSSYLVKQYVDAGCINHIIACTPTYKSNEDLFLQFGDAFSPDNVIEPNKDAPILIEKMVQDLADEYQQFLDDMEEYKRLKKKIKNGTLNIDEMQDAYEREILDLDMTLNKPVNRFGNVPPRIYVIFDDIIGSDLMQGKASKQLSQLLLKHRHMGELKDNVLGFSALIQGQSLKAQAGGISRIIRENCTLMMLIQKSKDKNMLKNIYEEVGSALTEEEFMALYDMACDDDNNPHNFLLLDFFPKCPTKKYRKNLDTYLILDKDKDKCKCNKRKNIK